MKKTVILTNANEIPDKIIGEILSIVSSTESTSINAVADLGAVFKDFVGGKSKSFDKALEKAKDNSLVELEVKAKKIGADAVISVRLDLETLGGDKKTFLIISATGTAVKFKTIEKPIKPAPPPSSTEDKTITPKEEYHNKSKDNVRTPDRARYKP